MKVRKFISRNTSAGLAQVRAKLGVNAVILSTRTTTEGVEILAVAEHEMGAVLTPSAEDLANASPTIELPAPLKARVATRPGSVTTPKASLSITNESKPFSFADFLRQPLLQSEPLRQQAHETKPRTPIKHQLFLDTPAGPPTMRKPERATPDAPVLAEIKALRSFMEERLEKLVWTDSLRRRPLAAALMCEMLGAGFSTALARAATEALPDDFSGSQARGWVRARLAPMLVCAGAADDMVERGGRYALTGPTGVGKTTTTAKIAARCVVRYGAQSLGLVTTDSYRIGAQDQLRIYGKILGVSVHTAPDALALNQVLDTLRDKRLVLIDTMGIGQRDERVAEQLAILDECKVGRVLLLAATSQLEIFEDVIEAYDARHGDAGDLQLRTDNGVILTKVDEAVKLGSVVDTLIRHKLRLQYVGTGQRVPEDLHLPDRDTLLDDALRVKGGPLALTKHEATLLLAEPLSQTVSDAARRDFIESHSDAGFAHA